MLNYENAMLIMEFTLWQNYNKIIYLFNIRTMSMYGNEMKMKCMGF